MSNICANCGKIKVYGNKKRHRRGIAGKRWAKRAQVTPRTFKPNIQIATVLENGKSVATKLCAKCIKKFKKEGKIISSNSRKIK